MLPQYDNSSVYWFDFIHAVTLPFKCNGNKRYLFVNVYNDRLTNGVASVTYNGVTMSLLKTQQFPTAPTREIKLYGLQNPASGINNIIVTATGTYIKGCLGVLSCYNTDGLRDTASKADDQSGSGNINIDVPSLNRDMTVDFLAAQIQGTITPYTGQTERYRGQSDINFLLGSDKKSTGNPTNMRWDLVPSTAWEAGIIAASLKPSGTTGGGNFRFPIIANRRFL